jgi:hypothetical protein
VVPRHGWRRGSPELGHSGGGIGRGRGGEGRGAYPQLVCGRGQAQGRQQPAGQRCAGSTTAAASAPADPQSVHKHGRHRDVVGVVWSCEKVVDYDETDRKRGLLGGRTGRTAACCGVRELAVVRSLIAWTRRRYTRHQCPGTATDVGLRVQRRRRRTSGHNAAAV